MPYRWDNFYQLAALFCLTVALVGCSSGSPLLEEDIQPVSVLEAQTDEGLPKADATPSAELPTEIDRVAAAPSPELPTELLEATSPITPPEPIDEATMTLSAQSINPLPGSAEALTAVMADLAGRVRIATTDDVTLISMESMDWSDASLGCPEEGMMYAQVITPGYLMVLEADGQQYTYHTDQNTSVTLCEP